MDSPLIFFTRPEKVEDSNIETNIPTKINVDFFTSGAAASAVSGLGIEMETDEKRKRGRPRKDSTVGSSTLSTTAMVPANSQMQAPETEFTESYQETTGLLRGTIIQIDSLSADIGKELETVKSSKTLKGKYNYITNMTGSLGALIGNKIAAIREMNSSITQVHNLAMKRAKDLKELQQNEVDDDRRIMEMYNAFTSMPMGTFNGGTQLAPPIQDITLNTTMPSMMIPSDMSNPDSDYQNYLNSMTPAQNAMRYEGKMEEVVVYNSITGERYFDIIDNTTGQSIPGVPRPEAFLLDETNGLRIDMANGVARNSNIDKTYRLVVVGSNPSINEY